MRDLRYNTGGQVRFATTGSEFFLLATDPHRHILFLGRTRPGKGCMPFGQEKFRKAITVFIRLCQPNKTACRVEALCEAWAVSVCV